MSGLSPTGPSDSVLVHVPFVFEARVVKHHGRKERRQIYRSIEPLELERISSAEVAYTVELGPDEFVDVLLHRGRIIWPIRYAAPFRRSVLADALRDLQDGTLDVFGGGKLKTSAPDLDGDLSWKKLVWNGREDAVQVLWRRSQALVVVGDELHAEGGMPIFVSLTPELSRAVVVASSGAGRHADPRVGALFVQPGGFHMRPVQKALALGRFHVPTGRGYLTTTTRRYPRIVAHREMPLDILDLRIDATFRDCWELLKALSPHPPSDESEWEWIRAKFEPALAGDLPDLSTARCEALHAWLACDPGLGRSHRGINMLSVLETAAAAGRTVTHPAYVKHLTDVEDAYIAAAGFG